MRLDRLVSTARRPGRALIPAAAAALLLAGCAASKKTVSPPLPPLSAVVLTPALDTLAVGAGRQFLATAYDAVGRRDRALDTFRKSVVAFERAISLNPGDTRAMYLGAVALERLGDSKRAEEWARRAVQTDPSHPLLLYNVACFHAVAGRPGLALDHLERAIEMGMRNRDWLMTDTDLESVRKDPRFLALLTDRTPPA